MTVALGVIMDPIATIKVAKDTTFAMLLEAQRRGWGLWYMEQADLRLVDGEVFARMRELKVRDDTEDWYEFEVTRDCPLAQLDVILMRKDPPFDMEYIYTTYLLEHAEKRGCLVINRPAALRDANEKLFTAWFPQCCPPTLVSRDEDRLRQFLSEQGEIVVKPLGGMGGASVFRVDKRDRNIGVILETLTDYGRRYTMAQRFIPEISAGDKRILVIGGKPVPYALARIPREGEHRGNLAAGGSGHGIPLSERDKWIVAQVAPRLTAAGILFAGLDVIGDFLTEINVTSPTCVRELDKIYDINISAQLMDLIEERRA